MSWAALDPEFRRHAESLLSPQQLEVVRHRANGHKWSVIAFGMNISESTARTHYRYAMAKLTRKEAA